MPSYEFLCKKCNKDYEELTNFDSSGKYKGVKCPACGSKNKIQKMTCAGIKFTNPRDTSKFDNFGYRAGYNLEQAQELRRNAEAASHVGARPYSGIDDVSSGKNFGEVE
jgi:putative FmdB family regulatory protein